MVDVTKPILSVSYLCENRIETRFVRQPFLKLGERHEPLIKKSGVYFAKTQIRLEVKGAVEAVMQDEGSQKSCVRGEGLRKTCVRAEVLQNSQKNYVRKAEGFCKILNIHKSHAYELRDCNIHKSHEYEMKDCKTTRKTPDGRSATLRVQGFFFWWSVCTMRRA